MEIWPNGLQGSDTSSPEPELEQFWTWFLSASNVTYKPRKIPPPRLTREQWKNTFANACHQCPRRGCKEMNNSVFIAGFEYHAVNKAWATHCTTRKNKRLNNGSLSKFVHGKRQDSYQENYVQSQDSIVTWGYIYVHILTEHPSFLVALPTLQALDFIITWALDLDKVSFPVKKKTTKQEVKEKADTWCTTKRVRGHFRVEKISCFSVSAHQWFLPTPLWTIV